MPVSSTAIIKTEAANNPNSNVPHSALNAVVSEHFPTSRIAGCEWVTLDRKFGGLIQTVTIKQIILKEESTHKSMEGRRFRIHQNPIYIKESFKQAGIYSHDPSQNYREIVSKCSVAPPVKAAANNCVFAGVDTLMYAYFATDKGRPTVKQGIKRVAIATARGFIDSVVPDSELIFTVGTAVYNGDYENLRMDIVRALPSLIPGKPIRWTREHTQANAPLRDNDLRSDNVHREVVDLSIPYLPGFVSAGFCKDKEQIKFSRDGINTFRDANTFQGHASIGTTFDASVGFTFGTEISEPVTKITEDGTTQTTQWKKEFSGQFGRRCRVADRKAATDMGPAFNSVLKTTTVKSNTDGSPIAVRNNLPLTHLTQVKDNLLKDHGIIATLHENYVYRETRALPTNCRVEVVLNEATNVIDTKQAFGLWRKGQKREKHDLYRAEENVSYRSDRELPDEIETTITSQQAILFGQDLRESSETPKKFLIFSSETKVTHYEVGAQREKEVVRQESTDKTQIISKKDGTPYKVKDGGTTIGRKRIKFIQKVFYKKIQHLGTSNELSSTVGIRETTATKREVKGTLQPEVITTYYEKTQTVESTKEDRKIGSPYLAKIRRVQQTFGLFTNKITDYEIISENGVPQKPFCLVFL
ncbi:unnamed protein product [Didymodactylos carnosus]|uniref:Uncharacterized protein n=1 Tax=Didymodactylos carnosus TaxID=1234261 RepID=A0A8S2JCW5_9BILA|nr:unnamed protein product [Didymodactylos carnosus]CAF3799012.1 unnamed protein product [Didymodactylos carnosus]